MKIKIPVTSTAISHIEYDRDTLLLTVYFTSDNTKGYDFQGVPQAAIDNFLKSDSKGRGYHQYLKHYRD